MINEEILLELISLAEESDSLPEETSGYSFRREQLWKIFRNELDNEEGSLELLIFLLKEAARIRELRDYINDLRWQANNGISDIAGMLNGGANIGAFELFFNKVDALVNREMIPGTAENWENGRLGMNPESQVSAGDDIIDFLSKSIKGLTD